MWGAEEGVAASVARTATREDEVVRADSAGDLSVGAAGTVAGTLERTTLCAGGACAVTMRSSEGAAMTAGMTAAAIDDLSRMAIDDLSRMERASRTGPFVTVAHPSSVRGATLVSNKYVFF